MRHADSGIGMDLESSFPSPLSPQEEAQNEDDYQLEVEVVSNGGGNNIPSGGMSEHAYSTASKLNPSEYIDLQYLTLIRKVLLCFVYSFLIS